MVGQKNEGEKKLHFISLHLPIRAKPNQQKLRTTILLPVPYSVTDEGTNRKMMLLLPLLFRIQGMERVLLLYLSSDGIIKHFAINERTIFPPTPTLLVPIL